MNREELKEYVCKELGVTSDELMWSDVCNNPSKGFKRGIDNTQVAIAGQGYWVLK